MMRSLRWVVSPVPMDYGSCRIGATANNAGSLAYHAVHLSYVQAFYLNAAFGCIALGLGTVKEIHGKISDLLELTPALPPAPLTTSPAPSITPPPS